eukprot:8714174-Alexandrium_andersonii.AAC.1
MRGSHGQAQAHAAPQCEYYERDAYGSDAQCFVEVRGSHGQAQVLEGRNVPRGSATCSRTGCACASRQRRGQQ